MWTPLGVANHTATWRPEPMQRGSWGVLSSCLATIGLCVWTAVHLNIPEHRQTDKHFWRKAKWVVLGLFSPEIICFIAFEQWRRQRKLHVQIVNHLRQDLPAKPDNPARNKFLYWWRRHQKTNPPGPAPSPVNLERAADAAQEQQSPKRKYPWMQLHTFYALMGGFAFDNSGHADSYPLPDGRTRVTLSPQGLLFLTEFRPDLIPDIPASYIKDKSKSEGIAKVVAFWQALWFVAQFITRISQGLHVSLLELNTILHVVCASVAYFVFWFHKPLDIIESTPIPVDNDKTAFICAAMASVSAIGAWLPELRTSIAYYMGALIHMEDGLVSERAQGLMDLFNSSALETGEYVLEPFSRDNRLKVLEMPTGIQQPKISIPQLPASCIIHLSRDNHKRSGFRDLNQQPGNTENFSKQLEESGHGTRGVKEEAARVKDATITIGNADLRRLHQALQGFAAYPTLYHPRVDDLVWRRASNLGLAFDNGSTMRTLFATIIAEAVGLLFSSDEGDQVKYRTRFKNAVSRFVHSSWVSVLGFLSASALYGGAHLLLGWNGPMNTETEVVLWRLSGFALFGPWAFLFGLIILVGGILVVFIAVLLFLVGVYSLLSLSTQDFQPPEHNSTDEGSSGGMVKFLKDSLFYVLLSILALPLFGILLIFLLSRLYLVVESLISLWYAPASVFVQPVWSAYVFHI